MPFRESSGQLEARPGPTGLILPAQLLQGYWALGGTSTRRGSQALCPENAFHTCWGGSWTQTNYPWTSEGRSSWASCPEGFRSPTCRCIYRSFPKKEVKMGACAGPLTLPPGLEHQTAASGEALQLLIRTEQVAGTMHPSLSPGLLRLSCYNGSHAGGSTSPWTARPPPCAARSLVTTHSARGTLQTRELKPVVWPRPRLLGWGIQQKPKAQLVWELIIRCEGMKSTW